MNEKISVLIVDDEKAFRVTLAKLLTSRGFSVSTVGSGQEAIEELGRNKYEVILLDVRMPGMDGIETLGKIKTLDPLAEVIVLTGHASVDDALALTRRGGSDYLLKPCPTDELAGKIVLAHERRQEKLKAMGPGGAAG